MKTILRKILRISVILRIFVNRKILILRIFLTKTAILRKILRIRIFVNTGPKLEVINIVEINIDYYISDNIVININITNIILVRNIVEN